MASWYSLSGWAKDNDRWYTKLFKSLNWALNPNHNWFDYDSWNENSTVGKIDSFLKNAAGAASSALDQLADPQQLTSLVNTYTGAHLTGSQIEANEMSMQNVEDQYQRQVTGMQKAGINPALMYQNGATGTAPAVQGSQGTASMSELMNAMLLKKQADLLDSQKRKTDTESDNIAEDTERMKLLNRYYPEVTETNLRKTLSEIGVNEETMYNLISRTGLNELDAELKRLDSVIKRAQANEASAYYKAVRELEEAKTNESKASAREKVAKAFMDEIEGEYMKHTNNKMGSASVVALAAAIGTLFDGELKYAVIKWFHRWIYDPHRPGLLRDLFEKFTTNVHDAAGTAWGGGGRD